MRLFYHLTLYGTGQKETYTYEDRRQPDIRSKSAFDPADGLLEVVATSCRISEYQRYLILSSQVFDVL